MIELICIVKGGTFVKIIFKNVVYCPDLGINFFLIFKLVNVNSSVIFSSDCYVI